MSSLRSALLQKLDHYLTVDNPAPRQGLGFFESISEKISQAVSSHGEEGRKRATTYKTFINTTVDDEDLLEGVIEDINKTNDGRLGTSGKVRLYMMEVLCEHLGISKQAIAKGARSYEESAIHAAQHSGHYSVLPYEERLKLAMRELINAKHKSTTRTIRSIRPGLDIGDDQL